MLLHGGGSLPLCFDFNFLSIAHRELAGKPFHAMNLEMVEICLLRKNVLLHIRTARQNNDLIQAVLRDQGSKLSWKLVYCPVCVIWRKTHIEISKSKKCTFPFTNLSTVKFRFLSKVLNFFRTEGVCHKV